MTKETLAKCKCLLWIKNQEKNGKKRLRVETENLKIAQALSSNTNKPAANSIYLRDFSHSESEISGKKFRPCSNKCIYASNQIVSAQLPRKILQSQTTATQAEDRIGLPTNHYFAVIASMIDASSGKRDDFVFLPRIGRSARSLKRKAISSQINQNFVTSQCLICTSGGFQFSYLQ